MIWINHDAPGYDAAVAAITAKIWGRAKEIDKGIAVICKDGGVILHDYERDRGVIEITAAGRGLITRRLLAEVEAYVFDQLKCTALIAKTDPANDRANSTFEKLGGQKTIVPDLGGEGIARLIWVLTRSRWSDSKFRRQHGQRT